MKHRSTNPKEAREASFTVAVEAQAKDRLGPRAFAGKKVKIHHPRPGTTLGSIAFMASGIASLATGPLLGILTGDRGTTGKGVTLREPPYWLVYFVLDSGPDPREQFTLLICSKQTGRVLDRVDRISFVSEYAIGITSPSIGSPDDRWCPDTFAPYGYADGNDFPIVSVTMTPSSGNPIDADSIYPDPQNNFWSATFPSLPVSGNNYTLTVTGSGSGNPATRQGLIMDRSLC
jgi:hypothetical protein